MNIPQLTESQLRLLMEITNVPGMTVFSQSSTLPTDLLNDSIMNAQAERDTEYLISIGFVKELTSENAEQLATLKETTGRTWRVFEITNMALKMFKGAPSNPTVN